MTIADEPWQGKPRAKPAAPPGSAGTPVMQVARGRRSVRQMRTRRPDAPDLSDARCGMCAPGSPVRAGPTPDVQIYKQPHEPQARLSHNPLHRTRRTAAQGGRSRAAYRKPEGSGRHRPAPMPPPHGGTRPMVMVRARWADFSDSSKGGCCRGSPVGAFFRDPARLALNSRQLPSRRKAAKASGEGRGLASRSPAT